MNNETCTLSLKRRYDDAHDKKEQRKCYYDGHCLADLLSTNACHTIFITRPGLETPATSWCHQSAIGSMDVTSHTRARTDPLDPACRDRAAGRRWPLPRSQSPQ